jgi:hypothetical protein
MSVCDPTWTFVFGVALLRYLGSLTSHEDTERPMYYQVISQCTQSLKNLEGGADLSEANLSGANLEGVSLVKVQLERRTSAKDQLESVASVR